MDDTHQAARAADFAAESVGAIGTFEQEQVAAQHQQALGRQIKFSGEGLVTEQQAAAMRRVGAHGAFGSERKAGIGAAFGAVPVHHVGPGLRGAAHDMGEHEQVAGIGVAAHRDAGEAKRERRLEQTQRVVGARAASARVGNQPDPVPTRGLLAREIEHMAKQTADRRTKHVQDIQWCHAFDELPPPRRIARRIREPGWLTKADVARFGGGN